MDGQLAFTVGRQSAGSWHRTADRGKCLQSCCKLPKGSYPGHQAARRNLTTRSTSQVCLDLRKSGSAESAVLPVLGIYFSASATCCVEFVLAAQDRVARLYQGMLTKSNAGIREMRGGPVPRDRGTITVVQEQPKAEAGRQTYRPPENQLFPTAPTDPTERSAKTLLAVATRPGPATEPTQPRQPAWLHSRRPYEPGHIDQLPLGTNVYPTNANKCKVIVIWAASW